MKAGREMDALVAEKVMGLRREVRAKGSDHMVEVYRRGLRDGDWYENDLRHHGLPRPYSTDIAAAWGVVEKLKEGAIFTRIDVHEDGYNVSVSESLGDEGIDYHILEADALTAPHAICLAALKAVGAEVPE